MGKLLLKKISSTVKSISVTLTEFGKGASYAMRH